MMFKALARMGILAGLTAAAIGCKTASKDSSAEKGLQVHNSDGTHDLYLWVTSKQFGGDTNICVFFNQSFTTLQADPRNNGFESLIYKSDLTRAWNSNYIPWTAYRRAFIATAQKLHTNLLNGKNTISYTARFADGSTGEKSIAIDANKYAEFVSWFMTDLHGRAPSKVEVKSVEIFNYMYAVMDNIDDRDQISGNACGKSVNKDPRDNVDVSDDVRMDLYRNMYGQLKTHLTGGWATGKAWYGWNGDFMPANGGGTVDTGSTPAGCPKSDPWNCYWNVKNVDKEAILASKIRGVGATTAHKMVEAGAFNSKPRTWEEFKAEIKRLSSKPGLNDLYDNVVGKFGSSNKDTFYND